MVATKVPPPLLPMLSARGTVLTSFVNEDRAALTNFVDSLLPKNPIVSYVVFTAMMETCVTRVKIVRCCWTVIDASNVWDRILGRIVVIPFPCHSTFVPSATFRTTGKCWAMSRCTKEGTTSIAHVRFRANDTRFFFGPFGVATHRTCARPCRN